MNTRTATRRADIEVSDHGGLYLFWPRTAAGREGLEEHYPEGQEHRYLGGRGLVVRQSHADEMAEGLAAAGLVVARY